MRVARYIIQLVKGSNDLWEFQTQRMFRPDSISLNGEAPVPLPAPVFYFLPGDTIRIGAFPHDAVALLGDTIEDD